MLRRERGPSQEDRNRTVKKKTLRKPEEPAQREFEEHMVLHIPFRAWCPHCVKGRAKAGPHKDSKAENSVPMIAMDYCYMKSAEDMRAQKNEN